MAVLPTPGSPIKIGLFFFLLLKSDQRAQFPFLFQRSDRVCHHQPFCEIPTKIIQNRRSGLFSSFAEDSLPPPEETHHRKISMIPHHLRQYQKKKLDFQFDTLTILYHFIVDIKFFENLCGNIILISENGKQQMLSANQLTFKYFRFQIGDFQHLSLIVW
jgi:hypothetical protein